MLRRGGLALALALTPACGGDDSPSETDPSSSTAGSTMTGATETGMTPQTDPGSESGDPGTTTDNGTSSGGEGTTTDETSGTGTSGSESGTTSAAGPTWDNFAESFFESYCWECHGAGDEQGRDYTTLAGVMAESNAIRCGTAPTTAPPSGCDGKAPAGQFPIGPTVPTDDERSTLVEWIDAGTP